MYSAFIEIYGEYDNLNVTLHIHIQRLIRKEYAVIERILVSKRI